MSILQHYYTSYANAETGSAGFQVKAMSQGITPDMQALIFRLIAYRIPPTLDERTVVLHPVALRYYYESSQRCFLLCSQSNGPDDNGRPGNFFAHTLIMTPESFKQIPPVLYWHSQLWRTRDQNTDTVLSPLPPEKMEPALDIDGIWDFLAQGKRLAYFYKLMCAVVQAQKSGRRIVIIDSAEHVALWVAALSAMLPPDYRPLLSFATYHHDPYQAQFMITGTTPDSLFRASAEEYMSFFVLNMELDKVSEVEDSLYAQEVARAGRSPQEYESHLLSLFSGYVPRFPQPTVIDEQLDQMVFYAHLLARKERVSLSANEYKAVTTVLATFDQSTYFSKEDIEEIKELSHILLRVWLEQQDEPSELLYQRLTKIQEAHSLSTDEEVLNTLLHATKDALRLKSDRAQSLIASALRTYGNELFVQILNGAAYWNWLRDQQVFDSITTQQLIGLWTCLGSYVHLGHNSEPLLMASLMRLGNENKQTNGPLYDALTNAVAGREKEILNVAVTYYRQLPREVVPHLYSYLLQAFAPEERVAYRAIVQQVVPDIFDHELRYQIMVSGVQNGFSEFERWILYAQQQRMNTLPELIGSGLRQLQRMCQQSPRQWQQLAPRILTSKILKPLPQNWEDHLVETALSGVSLSSYTPANVEMCEKYRSREGISVERRIVMNGLIAMKYGELDQELSAQLCEHFVQLEKEQPQQCKEETRSFVQQLMKRPIKQRTHNLMVNTGFSWTRKEYFWSSYWDALNNTIIDTARVEQGANVLEYWFVADPAMFTAQFTPHYFFLNLPLKIEEWQKERAFLEAMPSLMNVLSGRNGAWCSLALATLGNPRNLLSAAGPGFLAIGQGLTTLLRRGIDSKYASQQDEKIQAEQRRKDEFAANIAKLFPEKNVRQAHRSSLGAIYQADQRILFWECYWQQVTHLLLSQKATVVLDLLAFWFEDGYHPSFSQFCLPQTFFLEFGEAIEAVHKEQKFVETARKVLARKSSSHQLYPWYGVIQKYFMEPERKGLASFWRPRA